MAGPGWFVQLILGMLALGVAVLAFRSLRRAFGRPGTTTKAVEDFSISTGRVAIVVGLILIVALGRVPGFGSSVRTGGYQLVGLCCVGVLALAETRWPRQSGSVRTTSLQRRTVRSTVRGRYLGLAGAGMFASLIAGLAWWQLSDPASGGGSDREISVGPVDVTGAAVANGNMAAPIVGASPILLTGVFSIILTVAAGFAIRQVLNRPSLTDVSLDLDEALRRISAERLIRLVAAGWFTVAALISGELSRALVRIELPARGLANGMVNLFTGFNIVCGLALLVCYFAGPVRLPRQVSSSPGTPAR